MADLPIGHLPLPTRTKLRSTQILTSLPQIVSELLQNSLDAGALNIEIGVNCEEWMCWVTDDGHGITRDGLSLLSKAERYGSSKAYTLDTLNVLSTFGFRGEALASAADLGCLEISSRTSRSKETYSLIMKDAKTIYSGTAVRWKRSSQGTTVCVRDAFYNLPVRRLSHPSPTRSFDAIRRELETYALVFPQVSFNLYLSCTGNKENTLRIPRSSSTLEAFRRVYGRALCEHVHNVNVEEGDLKLEGFISLDGAISQSHQFLYVNRHPVNSDLQRLIGSRFAPSSFSKHAYEESGETQLRPSTRRSPRKSEKKPVYVLNLIIPPDRVDNLLEPAKGLLHFGEKPAVESLLSATIDAFLIRYGFSLPTARKERRSESDSGSPSPRKQRKLHRAEGSGYAEEFSEEICPYDLKSKPVPMIAPLFIDHAATDEETFGGDEIIWTDSATGQTFAVDRRTGHSRLQGDFLANPDRPIATSSRERRTLSTSRFATKSDSHEAQAPEWIRRALEANESYSLVEQRIRSVKQFPRHDEGQLAPNSDKWAEFRRPATSNLSKGLSNLGLGNESMKHSFSREDLQDSQVINQVDRKFVACAFNGSKEDENQRSRTTLVLIDQHAADERIRVELFLKDLCLGFLRNIREGPGGQGNDIETRHLTPPVPVLLTRLEVRRLSSSRELRDAFWSWGICFTDQLPIAALDHEAMDSVDGDDSSSNYVQIAIERVPEVVADKLLSADELRDLVKTFLAEAESDRIPIVSRPRSEVSESEENESDWLRALRWCPRHLLELVNSKACRGAIMFNDPLSDDQCCRLVEQLSETAQPFQCAHGRPSLVPLAHFGHLARDRGKSRHSQVNWAALEEQMHPD